jgi:hypothetical protein
MTSEDVLLPGACRLDDTVLLDLLVMISADPFKVIIRLTPEVQVAEMMKIRGNLLAVPAPSFMGRLERRSAVLPVRGREVGRVITVTEFPKPLGPEFVLGSEHAGSVVQLRYGGTAFHAKAAFGATPVGYEPLKSEIHPRDFSGWPESVKR